MKAKGARGKHTLRKAIPHSTANKSNECDTFIRSRWFPARLPLLLSYLHGQPSWPRDWSPCQYLRPAETPRSDQAGELPMSSVHTKYPYINVFVAESTLDGFLV